MCDIFPVGSNNGYGQLMLHCTWRVMNHPCGLEATGAANGELPNIDVFINLSVAHEAWSVEQRN